MAQKAHPNDDQRPLKGKSSGLINKWAGAGGGEGKATAAWGYCDTSLLTELIDVVTGAGAAIMFGYSADRGAYLITILDGPDRHKEWIPCTTDVNEVLARMIDAFRA